jgi:trimeric autotransporter adhesin
MRHVSRAASAAFVLAGALFGQCWAPGPGAPGAYGPTSVLALHRHDDGSGSKLYVGGLFDAFGAADCGGLAVRTPGGFAAVGGRKVVGDVACMTTYGGDLIVGGQFSAVGEKTASNVARWDGTKWNSLSSGTNGWVYALAVYGGDLYAAGSFTTAGGAPASRIARWNGSSWSAVSGGVDATAYALAVFQNELYVGGGFSLAGGAPAARVARWNGGTWATAGAGIAGGPFGGAVFAFEEYDLDGVGPAAASLLVGGNFSFAGGASVSRIAAWDGFAWSAPVPSAGFSATGAEVNALESDGAFLFIGGSFTVAGASNLASFAFGVVAPPTSTNGVVRALDCDGAGPVGAGGSIVVGGDFTAAGGVIAFGAAEWNGSTPAPLVGGFGGESATVVDCAVVWNGDVVVGGRFSAAPGNVAAMNVARRTSGGWVPLGSGLEDAGFRVFDLAVHGGDLYAAYGGSNAALGARSRIAKFDGATWTVIADAIGVGQNFYALESLGGLLYAAGSFTNGLGGFGSPRVAVWNGSTWSGVGAGFATSSVHDLVEFGGELYACGDFVASGASAVAHVARFDGAAWQPLGSGLGGPGLCLAVHDDGGGPALYVGGMFTTAGGATANRVAKWNGAAWSAVAGGFTPSSSTSVLGLASSGGVLYATGLFAYAGSPAVGVARAARLLGGAWQPLGSGLSILPTGVASTPTGAVFVGEFVKAGGFVSHGFAEWVEGAPTGAPSITSVDPPTLPKQPLGGAPVLVVATGSNFTVGTVFHISGVPVVPIATTCSAALFSLHPNLVPQLRRDGALAIVAVNGASSRSAAAPLPIGFGSTTNNQGLIVRTPFGVVSPGATVQYSVEGGAPGGALLVLVDLLSPLPISGFPDASSNFAFAVGPFSGQASAMFPIADGFGLFGPPTPSDVLDPSGAWTSPPLVLPAPAAGFAATMQAVYADTSAPLGIGATFALWPETL